MQHQPEACASDLGGDQSRYLYEKNVINVTTFLHKNPFYIYAVGLYNHRFNLLFLNSFIRLLLLILQVVAIFRHFSGSQDIRLFYKYHVLLFRVSTIFRVSCLQKITQLS